MRVGAVRGLSTLLLVASLSAAGEPAVGARLELHLHGSSRAPRPVVVVVTPEAGEVSPIRLEAAAPGSLVLPRLETGGWRLQAEAAGTWSAPLRIEAPVPPGGLDLHLWPETRVRAALRVPKGSTLPAAVSLRLQKADARGRSAAFEPATMLCPVDDQGLIECRLPRVAGLDVRLRSPGFASRFFWDLDLSGAATHDLGEMSLRPGASVIGRLEVPPGYQVGEVEVRLVPSRSSPHPVRGNRVVRQALTEARPDERGFFSLEGLAAGAYDLRLSHPGLADLELAALRVVEGAQTEIAEPLALSEPASLRLVLAPPFDPYGGDWKVDLLHRQGPLQRARLAEGEAPAATAGFLEVPAPRGAYEVQILNSRGVRVATEEIEFDGRSEPYTLEIEPVLVEGLVSLGDEPILARVTFRGTHTLEMDADVDGRFGGYLPRAGEWDVEVHAFDPPVSRRTRALEIEVDPEEDRAVLHLRLPDTTVRGTVVDPQGTPVPAAQVTVTDPHFSTREVLVSTDEEGDFEVRGLDEGPVLAQATLEGEGDRQWSSRPETGEIREKAPLELRLVLRENARLRGRLLAADGNPLPNAWIETLAYTAEGWFDALFSPPRTTDAAGRFDASVPASTAAVHLVILAPGHPLTSRVMEVGDVGDLVLGASAGDLAIDLPARVEELPWEKPAVGRPTLVTPDGSRLPLNLLAQWSALHGQPWNLEDRRIVLPALAPGVYAVCWFTTEESMRRHATGSHCARGEIQLGSALVLPLSAVPGLSAAPSPPAG